MKVIGQVPLATTEELGSASPAKQCSRTNSLGKTPPNCNKLESFLTRLPLPDAIIEDVREAVQAITEGDLPSLERITRTYESDLRGFIAMRDAVSAILPSVSYGALEILPTVPYRTSITAGISVDAINLSVRQSGSTLVVGIPNHSQLRSEVFRYVDAIGGSLLPQPDSSCEPKRTLKQIAQSKNWSRIAPPPMFVA